MGQTHTIKINQCYRKNNAAILPALKDYSLITPLDKLLDPMLERRRRPVVEELTSFSDVRPRWKMGSCHYLCGRVGSYSDKLHIDDANFLLRMIHPQSDNGISFYKNSIFPTGWCHLDKIRLPKGIGSQCIQNVLRSPPQGSSGTQQSANSNPGKRIIVF